MSRRVVIEDWPDPMDVLRKKMGQLVVFMAILTALAAVGKFLHGMELNRCEGVNYGEAYAVPC